MSRPSFARLTRLALATAVSLSLPAVSAFAAPVLGASSSAMANGIAGTTSPISLVGYEASQSSASQLAGFANANSFASSYGAYVVRSNAEGKGASTAHAQFLYTLTNTSGVAQTYTMSFHIYGGSINTNLANATTAALTGAESLGAQYAASIKVGASTLFSTQAAVARNAAGTSGSQSGTVLNAADDFTDGAYSWGSGDYVVNLGLLADGASMSILAQVDSGATADVGTYIFNGDGGYGGCGYGGGGYNTVTPSNSRRAQIAAIECFKGRASGFYGDPSDFFGNPGSGQFDNLVSFVGVPASGAVPEPGSLLLAALALGGAAATAGRKRG
jgi:hypothetical protein